MVIDDSYKHNFKTLRAAVLNEDAALVCCKDVKTGDDVIVIAAVFQDDSGQYNMVPLAKMFDGNPYEELDPPTTYEALKVEKSDSENTP